MCMELTVFVSIEKVDTSRDDIFQYFLSGLARERIPYTRSQICNLTFTFGAPRRPTSNVPIEEQSQANVPACGSCLS
jgi:hypothetical protein